MAKDLLHSEILDRIRASETQKSVMLPYWMENIAFFMGWHYVQYGEVGQRMIREAMSQQSYERQTHNYIQPIVLSMVAKLTQNRPGQTCLPATNELDDRRRARLATSLLEQAWEDGNCQAELVTAVQWSVLTGNGAMQLFWDDDVGDIIEGVDPVTGDVLKGRKSGGVVTEAFPPLDLGLDPLVDDPAKCAWGWRKHLVTKSWLRDKLGVKSELNGDSGVYDDFSHREADSNVLSDTSLGDEYLTVVDFYDVAGKRRYLVDRDKILKAWDWDRELPFMLIRPFAYIGDLSGGSSKVGHGGCWGDTPLRQIIPLQRRLNRLNTQTVTILDHVISPRLLVDRRSKINLNHITTVPGTIIEYSGFGQRPSPLNMGHFPAVLLQLTDKAKEEMYEIMGIHEISMGQHPGSLQSGRGLMILLEADSTKLGPWLRAIGRVVREHGRKTLEFYRDYSQYDVLLRIIGESGQLEIDSFYAGEINSTDVRVEDDSTLAINKQLRNQEIMNMFNQGLLTDRRQTLKMMEFGSLQDAIGGQNDQRLRQKREISAMLRGGTATVEPWDDHDQHQEELRDYVLSRQFEELPSTAQAPIRAHYMEHEQMRLAAMQAPEMMAANARGIAAAGAAKIGFSPELNSGLNPQSEAAPIAMGE